MSAHCCTSADDRLRAKMHNTILSSDCQLIAKLVIYYWPIGHRGSFQSAPGSLDLIALINLRRRRPVCPQLTPCSDARIFHRSTLPPSSAGTLWESRPSDFIKYVHEQSERKGANRFYCDGRRGDGANIAGRGERTNGHGCSGGNGGRRRCHNYHHACIPRQRDASRNLERTAEVQRCPNTTHAQ